VRVSECTDILPSPKFGLTEMRVLPIMPVTPRYADLSQIRRSTALVRQGGEGRALPGATCKAHAWAGGTRPATGLTAPPWLSLLLCCDCTAVRLCGWPPAPVAMAVEVVVGYVRWVAVWARAWEGGGGALLEGPSGMGLNGRRGERNGRMGDWRGSGMGGPADSLGLWDFRTNRARRA
jgi:hypothetical protein